MLVGRCSSKIENGFIFFTISLKKSCHISVMGSADSESRSVGFEPTTSGFGDPRSTELN